MSGIIHPDQDLHLLLAQVLSNNDIHQKLAFPVPLLDHLWPEGVPNFGTKEFTVLDVRYTPWRFTCKLRPGRPQPQVSGSAWKKFVQQKDVRAGDELVFYLPPHLPQQQEAPPVFVISVRREIRILGIPVPAHILL